MLAAPPAPEQPPQAGVAAVPDPRETVRRELLQLKGTWSTLVTVESTVGGVVPPSKKEKMTWSIDRDIITEIDREGFAVRTYRFSIDLDHTPKTVDLDTLNSGLALHGLYKLEGDTLTVCEGLKRPRGFEQGPAQFLNVFHRESRTPARPGPRFPNAEGCYWAIEPMGNPGLPTAMTNGGINLLIRKARDGAMLVTLASLSRLANGEPEAEYRPVALDGDNQRFAFQSVNGGWGTSPSFRGVVLNQQEFRLDPAVLPFDRVQHMGIEVVPAEVRRVAKGAASASSRR